MKTMFISILTFLSFSLFSQKGFNIHFGPSSPLGAYSETSGENSVGAGTGFLAGIGYDLNLVEGLNFDIEIEYNYNPSSDAYRESIDREFSSITTIIDYPEFRQFNFLTGLTFRVLNSEKFDFYLSGNLGAGNVIFDDFSVTSISDKLTFEFDPEIGFVYRLGFGFLLVDRISLGAYYYDYGVVEGNARTTFNNLSETFDYSFEVKYFLLKLGVHF